MLSPTSRSSVGPDPSALYGGGRLDRGRRAGFERLPARPDRRGELAGLLDRTGCVVVGHHHDGHAHLGHVGVGKALAHRCAQHPGLLHRSTHVGDHVAHRRGVRVLAQNVDRRGNRFERQRGTDLAADGTDDQLGHLARRVSGIEVGVGAVRVEHVGVLTHLAADVGVQIERHPDRDVRADLLPEPAKEKAVGVGMVVGDGRAVQRGQHAVEWTVVAERRHQLLDARVEGVRSERAPWREHRHHERDDLDIRQLTDGQKT